MTEERALRWLRTHPDVVRKQAAAQNHHCVRCQKPLDCWIPIFIKPPKHFQLVCETCETVH